MGGGRSNLSPALAKISSPALANIYRRVRLFRLLDRARRQPIVWISGPGGAGKTTLVASYLAACKLKHLWYQLDIRDSDPATFFYYLREAAARRSPRARTRLPLLTPEYAARAINHRAKSYRVSWYALAVANPRSLYAP